MRPRRPRALHLVVFALGIVTGVVAPPVLRGLPRSGAANDEAALSGAIVEPATGSVNLGPAPVSEPLHIDVVLRSKNPVALASYAAAVSDPSSPLYRHYLSVAQFVTRFAPGADVVVSVERALATLGLRRATISSNGLDVEFATTVGAADKAFGLGIDDVRTLRGTVALSPDRAPRVPQSIAASVEYVAGLTTLDLPAPNGTRGPAVASAIGQGGASSCSGAASTGGIEPGQLSGRYDLAPLYRSGDGGAASTVDLFELEPFSIRDVTTFQRCFHSDATVWHTSVDGASAVGAGSGEAAADVEDVIAIAPSTRIDVYEGPYTESGVIDTYSAMVDADRAQIISTSWGVCDPGLATGLATAENTIFEQAATEGITVLAASGDRGSEDCANSMAKTGSNDELAVDDPADQPFVTGVGGTMLENKRGATAEVVWNSTGINSGAGGGGLSTRWSVPSWQVAATATSPDPSERAVPDVSADAGGRDGYAIVVDHDWTTFSGTSVAAPLWAGVFALVDSTAACRVSGGVGFANPKLYSLGDAGRDSAFHDITVGNNDLLGDHPGDYQAHAGYNEASGLGTPRAARLAAALCG